MKRLLQLVLVLGGSLAAMAQPPQVPVYGPIGAGFNGPLINSPAVIFATDADHTMVYPEMSGSSGALIVTSSVSLTATRNVIVPNTGNFTWPIINSTSGGNSITFKVAGGTGVTIANGAVATVLCDTVNCYSPPSGGGGGGGSGGTIIGTITYSSQTLNAVGNSLSCVFNDTSVFGTVPSGALVAVSPTSGINSNLVYAITDIASSFVGMTLCNVGPTTISALTVTFNVILVGGGGLGPIILPVTCTASCAFNALGVTGFSSTLTQSFITSSITGETTGQYYTFTFTQDATGGRSCAYPSGTVGASPCSLTANAHTQQKFFYNGANLIADASAVIY